MNKKQHRELIDRARSYLAANAAESGSDVLIDELTKALEGFQFAGWATPGEHPSEVHEDLGEFVLDYHPAAGAAVLDVMPVWVSAPMWANAYTVGSGYEGDTWEEVDLHDTKEQAELANAKYEAAIEKLDAV